MPNKTPFESLSSLAKENGLNIMSLEFALFMDERDEMKHFRKRFAYPKKGGITSDKSLINPDEECVYLCGNSLGIKPLKADTYVQEQLDKWAKIGLEMHFEGHLPAASCDRYGRDMMGDIVGADASTVTLMNGLSVNLHLLLLSFYQPNAQRFKILVEKHAFPSDTYALKSQAALRGLDPKKAIIEVAPREGEETLRTEDIIKVIKEEGSTIAVVCLSGVQYYTGQKFDMEKITKAAHKEGCLVGWDLAHAIGNVNIELDNWGVDFACWCTYKYLNSGPGCIAGAYVNKKHNNRSAAHLHGWWSNTEETRFEMREECDVAPGVDGFRICNPPPVLVAIVMASLEIFADCGMPRILRKQFLLTGYLETMIKHYFVQSGSDDAPSCTIITPANPEERGSQLSLIFSIPLEKVHNELKRRGIVCDIRKPNVMRLSPAPLYNSYKDVYNFVTALQEVFQICMKST